MTIGDKLTTRTDLKIVNASFRMDHLIELFPQIADFAFDEEKLKGFIKRHFQGAAHSFQITIDDERISLNWGVVRASAEAETLNREALAAAKERKFERAAELWRKAILLHKDDPDYHYNLGLALIELKQYIKGLDRCKEALSICPIYYRADFVLGSIYSKQRQFEASELYLRNGLLFLPENVAALINLGAVLSIRKKYDNAIRVFEKAIALSPKDAKTYLGMGKVYVLLNDFDNAGRCFKVVMKLDPQGRLGQIAQTSLAALPIDSSEGNDKGATVDVDRIYTEAHHAFLNGDFSRAQSLYEQYIGVKPRDANAWSTLAACHLRLGNQEKAINSVKSAIKLVPGRAAFYKQAGIIYNAFEMHTESGQAAQRAIQLGKKDSVTIALFGISRLKNNSIQESIRILGDAVAVNPNNLKARYYLAQGLAMNNQNDLARQNLEEILWSTTASPLKEKARILLNDLEQTGR